MNAEGPPLEAFHPLIRTWFSARFPAGPSDAQSEGWPSIQQGRDTLLAAPTGSGKTLAAFLVFIDQLYRDSLEAPLADQVEVLYVSPLKALASDITENLERPLRELTDHAEALGLAAPSIRVASRTGDTPASRRAQQLKKPPHILVTTPESLYLLLTADKSRALLSQVRAVIVDEIHALARDKRGTHLSLSLERLDALCTRRPMRIGLSATQRPLPQIAEFLVGCSPSTGNSNPCVIVDQGHHRTLDLGLCLPGQDLAAVTSTDQLEELVGQIAEWVKGHRTTLIFTNTRRLAERVAHRLEERLGESLGPGQVAAHHGSLSKERRFLVEGRLRRGELRALVATASLELGIDIGPIDLVCQLGSPRSIATFLQRVGRAGHNRFATPKGRLFPLTRDELVECTALLRSVDAFELDRIRIPTGSVDILLQQLVAECAAQPWEETALFERVKRAAPYKGLSRETFDELLSLFAAGIDTGRGSRAAYLHRDGVNGVVRGRRGARLAALTSGGAIPEVADYRVIEEPTETFIGTINEDFAIESMAGDVFLLGTTSWRIRRVSRGEVRVVSAEGAAPSIPFWLGEAPSRTLELSEAVSRLRQEVMTWLDMPAEARAEASLFRGSWLAAEGPLLDYLTAARDALGLLPTQEDLIVERFFDESGGMQLVVHSPYGGRINRGLGLLMRKRFCRSFDFELQAAANDDAVVLSLGAQHSFPLEEVRDFLSPSGIRKALVHAVLVTPIFQARWRWNLNRALIVLRTKGGRKNPPQFQRMESDDVMAAVFPSLAACQDNATGPRDIPDHPIVMQTLEDCLSEAIDLEGLQALLDRIEAGSVRLHFRDTTEPSLLGHEILSGRPYTFLDDAPLEERRTRAVQLRPGLPVAARDLAALDADAIDQVVAEARDVPRNAEELHDLLQVAIALAAEAAWEPLWAPLSETGRAGSFTVGTQLFWFAAERRAELQALFVEAEFSSTAKVELTPQDPERTALQLVAALLDRSRPMTLAQLSAASGFTSARLGTIMSLLEQQGVALQGHFDPRLTDVQFVHRRLLSRMHQRTRSRLRREIEPVSPQDFQRFLFSFHGLSRSAPRRRGPEGVLRTLEQLQGFETAATLWESEVLPARVFGYSAEDLDTLCWSGDVCWGRLSLRAARPNDQWANVHSVTPITLALREDFPWLQEAVRRDAQPALAAQAWIEKVPDALSAHGALFFSELRSWTELNEVDLNEALWDGVARGRLTSDGFSALRRLLSGRSAAARIPTTRRSLRLLPRIQRPREGRWALLGSRSGAPRLDPETLAEHVAEQLLCRYGVVFYELLERESFAVPWRQLLWAFRRLEARGLIRGGRFVSGFVGEQFALPEAVAQLREMRRTPLPGERLRLSAGDPLNLVGIVVPGPRVAATPGRWVTFVDGVAEPAQSDPSSPTSSSQNS